MDIDNVHIVNCEIVPTDTYFIMNLHLEFLANFIIQQYFLNSRCLFVFSDKSNPFFYNGSIPIIFVNVENDDINSNLIFHYFGCQGIIIANDKPSWTLQMFEKIIRLNMERFNNRRYLVLHGSDTKDNIKNIFELKELEYFSDLVVVEEYSKDKKLVSSKRHFMKMVEDVVFKISTHQYVGEEHNKGKVLLDYWYSNNKSFKFNSDLYPSKLLNQRGRGLRMAAFQYEPYSIIGSTEDELKGSEMAVAVAFAKHFNMTPIPVVNAEDYWGEIFENWTGNGLLGNIALDNADLGFSALYTWEEDYHYLDLSKPLVRTGITCIVPAPKLAQGWVTPLYSYSCNMWIAVGVIFFTCIFSLFYLHYFYSKMTYEQNGNEASRQHPERLFGYSVFSIIKLFVLQAVTKKEIPAGFNGTYFMGLLFLFSLFLTSTYSSGLSSIMTVPRYENPINTVNEFVASGLYWGATQDAWISSIQKVEDPTYKAIVQRFVPTSEEKLREYSLSGSFAFSLERLPHENYAIGTYIKEDVIGNYHLMQEDFYWEQCVIMTRKSSVLLPLLDLFILRVFESGLISYWQNEAVSLYMNSYVQQIVKYYNHHQDRVVVKLKWSHVQGAFGILCLGYIISLTVFCLEICIDKFKNGKKNDTD